MKREILSVVGAIAVVVILAVLSFQGVIVLSDISAALAYALVTTFFGMLLWGFGPRIKRIVRGEIRENMAMAVPSQKGVGWLSRLRVPPTRKEYRFEFWTTVIVIEVIGPIFIYAVLNLLPLVSLQPAKNLLVITTITFVGGLISIMTLFAWLAINDLYAIWESRQQLLDSRKMTYLNLVKSFDEAFEAVQEVHEPDLKVDMLARFQPKLRDLAYNYTWDVVKDRIEKVLKCIIPEKLFNESPMYLQFLALIINRFGEHATSMISEKWLKEIEKSYDDLDYRTDSISYVLYILQELHGYKSDYIEKLIDDASTQWTELKWQLLANQIDFSEMSKKDALAHKRILTYLRRKMDDAAKNKEDKVKDRLRFLYDRAMM